MDNSNDKKFTNLNDELSYLKKKISDNFFKISKKNSFTTLQITLRKALMLQIVIQDEYPSQWPNSVSLHTFDLSILKSTRQQAIESFIKSTNLDLNTIIDDNQGKCCIVKLYEKALGLHNMNEFMNQSFSVLETQSKHAQFLLTEEEKLVSKMSSLKSDDTVSPKAPNKSEIKPKANADEDDEGGKKKFKGSEYVFQRIKWDSKINKDEIVIGYLDRFLGIKEIKFNDFKGVHEDKEGIPQHRIRYFKINQKIVWDREQRIDLLTGSEIDKFFIAPVNDQTSSFADEVEKNNVVAKEQIFEGPIFRFDNNKANWDLAQDSNEKNEPKLLNSFKLLTYNIMSRNNFKKSILQVIAELNYTDSEIGIKSLYQIERIDRIASLFESNSPEFILLQECEAYEEEKLREYAFIRSNYYICSGERGAGKEEHSNCVILSKLRPRFFKQIRLNSNNSNKQALVAKYDIHNSSLSKTEELLVINVHLTSSKALNYELKRREQLETLKKYLTEYEHKHELSADYVLLCGDFNFGDGSDFENRLLNELFLSNGFEDLCPSVATFDPTNNFSASLTSHQNFARRLDRILFKSNKSKKKCELVDACIVNTAPFEIHPGSKISYQPYTNIKTRTTKNQISISNKNEDNSEYLKPVEANQFYLHPSDHFGIECTFKFQNKLDESSLGHKSSLAIIAPKYASENYIQQVRLECDPQINRWPPHFNLLYPFYEDIGLSLNEDEETSVIGDVLSCLSQFEAFECDLSEMDMFSNNNVVFLSPDKEAKTKMELIYTKLIQLFDNSTHNKWRNKLAPHMTIAQPVDKKNCAKNWAKATMERIKTDFDHLKQANNSYAKFTVDCIYWIKRTDTTPFEIKFAFPLGKMYPVTIAGLNPVQFKSDECLLKFLYDKHVVSSKEEHAKLVNQYKRVVSGIVDALENSKADLKESKKEPLNKHLEFEAKSSAEYFSLLLVGSFLHGIKSYDLDFVLLNVKLKELGNIRDEQFSKNLTYGLSQNSDLFHIVRNIPDANVPIIELCLKSHKNESNIKGADIQIHELDQDKLNLSKSDAFINDKNLFFDNYRFMRNLSESLSDYNKLHAISGLFENQNLKKYINNYKDYQVLISFVKYWAKCRNIYGKANAYLGGISWSIMVIFFLQNSIKSFTHKLELDNSSARFTSLVQEFFTFYSKWNWHNAISLIRVDFVLNVANKYLHKSPMTILQSVFPYHNTSKNVSEQYKKIIYDEIERGCAIFHSGSSSVYKTCEMVCQEIAMNDMSSNILAFKLEYNLPDDLTHLLTLVKAKMQGLITSIQRECKHDIRVYPNLFEDAGETMNKRFKHRAHFYIDLIDNVNLNETKPMRLR